MADHAQEPKATYSKVIVALCLVTIIAYTVTCFFYLWHAKPLNDVLTALFFGCFGIEFASLAFIKRSKLKYTYTSGNPANRQMPHISLKEEEDEQVHES